jgi:hypothetical protein
MSAKNNTTPTLLGEENAAFELSYYDDTNPKALVNLVPPRIAELMQDKYTKYLLGLSNRGRQRKIKPDTTLNRLRVSFWKEYDLALANKREIIITNVYAGICSKEYFDGQVENIESLAWILSPTTSYVNMLEESLNFGLERLREILEMPLYERKAVKKKTGGGEVIKDVPNVKLAALMVKVVEMLDNRVKGAIVKKIENKSVNVNANVTAPKEASIDLDNIPFDVMERMVREHQGKDTVDADYKEVDGKDQD